MPFFEAPNGLYNVNYVRIKGGSGSYLRLGPVTTTQRDALPQVNGTMVYNSTTNALNVYEGGAWGALGNVLADGSVPFTAPIFIAETAAAAVDQAGYGQIWVKTGAPNTLWFVNESGTEVQLGVGSGGDLKADGTIPLTANWDVGAFTITGTQFISDIAIGTAPFVATSTTVVTNLNADLLDGVQGADFIHDNVAGEILAIAQDTAPIGTHEFLAENAAGTKKAVPFANMQTPWLGAIDANGEDIADLGTLNFDDATTLQTTVTATVIDNCEVAWTTAQGANVVCSQEGTIKQVGTYSAKVDVQAGATVGLLAYNDFSAEDLSTYCILRLWIRSDTALINGVLQIQLDDTSACASPLVSLPVQELAANTWVQLFIPFDGGLAGLNATISVGVYAVLDSGAYILYLDDVAVEKGTIAATQSYHLVDTSGGTLAASPLSSISGGAAGDELILRLANNARPVYIGASVGNIMTSDGGGEWLRSTNSPMLLICDGTDWYLSDHQTQSLVKLFRTAHQECTAQTLEELEWTNIAIDRLSEFSSGDNGVKIKNAGTYIILSKITAIALIADTNLQNRININDFPEIILPANAVTTEVTTEAVLITELKVDDIVTSAAYGSTPGDNYTVYCGDPGQSHLLVARLY